MKKGVPFSRVRDQLTQNPEFRREYDALEDEFSLIRQAIAAREGWEDPGPGCGGHGRFPTCHRQN